MKAKVFKFDPETGRMTFVGVRNRSAKSEPGETKQLAGVCDPFNTLQGGKSPFKR